MEGEEVRPGDAAGDREESRTLRIEAKDEDRCGPRGMVEGNRGGRRESFCWCREVGRGSFDSMSESVSSPNFGAKAAGRAGLEDRLTRGELVADFSG